MNMSENFKKNINNNLELMKKELQKVRDKSQNRKRSLILMKKSDEDLSVDEQLNGELNIILVQIESLTDTINQLEQKNTKHILNEQKLNKIITIKNKEIETLQR